VNLDGARVLITGASGGIGNATARALRARGAHVVLSGRRREALEQLRHDLGSGAEVLVADLANHGAIAALAEKARGVDVLVANAGLPASGTLLDFSPEEIDTALDVNLRAPMQLVRALMPGMVERGRGHVVLLSSLHGKAASSQSSVYSASKFGLRGFATALREDLKGTGVGVTVVFPGFIRDAGMFAETGVRLPLWVGTRTPEDVASAVVRGVERERPELDVAPLALRLGALWASVAPVTSARLQRRLGSRRLGDAIVDAQRVKR
jgi:short-subunit dehydrogenase